MSRIVPAALVALLLSLVLAAAPASAGELSECGVTPAAGSEGACLLVVDDGTVVTEATTLPRTGGDSLPLARIGIVLVAVGGLVVALTRTRRSTAQA